MPELKRPFAEFLLALFAGRARAAAIHGDLLELSATRGHLWFVAAYTRTLFTFTWRILLALFVADIGRQFLFDLFHLWLGHTPASWRTAGGPWLNLTNSAGPLLACIMSTLWFALPFTAVLYGTRDRFVRLTVAIALGTTIGFMFIPWASAFLFSATFALAVAAFFSKAWRRPVLVLAGTGAAGLAVIFASLTLLNYLKHLLPVPSMPAVMRNANMIAFQVSLLAIALVCSRLHRRLLEPLSGDHRTIA
jgi:hypothetical protein